MYIGAYPTGANTLHQSSSTSQVAAAAVWKSCSHVSPRASPTLSRTASAASATVVCISALAAGAHPTAASMTRRGARWRDAGCGLSSCSARGTVRRSPAPCSDARWLGALSLLAALSSGGWTGHATATCAAHARHCAASSSKKVSSTGRVRGRVQGRMACSTDHGGSATTTRQRATRQR